MVISCSHIRDHAFWIVIVFLLPDKSETITENGVLSSISSAHQLHHESIRERENIQNKKTKDKKPKKGLQVRKVVFWLYDVLCGY